MAISVDWATKTFSVPQSDLTLVTGTLYDLNTETQFRQAINAIMASEDGIVFAFPIRHNTEVTVAGTTFARTIEVINGYSVTFTPDTQWSARLSGSNNNIFDVENGILNQNQVQVIPTNSAGLIKPPSGQPSKNVALNDFVFTMEDSSGTPLTGLTVSATRALDGGTFIAATNSPVEMSAGYYSIDLSASDMNGGVVALRFTAATAVDRQIVIVTEA